MLIVLINGVNYVVDRVRRRASNKVKCIHNLLSLSYLLSSCLIQLRESNRIHQQVLLELISSEPDFIVVKVQLGFFLLQKLFLLNE